VTFPLVFASSTFTSTETMPDWLHALAWSAAILIVAATLAIRRFREV
jgi:hypothetical protein